MRLTAVMTVSLLIVLSLVLPAGAAAPVYPEVISLPDGFAPEGIASGRGHTFYAGSLADGSIWAGDLRSGEGSILVPGGANAPAVGMNFDERTGYLFVAGGPSGKAYVYDTRDGSVVAVYQIDSTDAYFVNDVIVTRQAAYFTNSFGPSIYRLPLAPTGALLPSGTAIEELELTGDWQQVAGFNANGIEATADGSALIVINSTSGLLYRVDPASGAATEIELGGATLTAGDGILLDGKTLYVVRNSLNEVAVVSLAPDLSSGMVLASPITSPYFNVPTTVAEFGNSLYAVNAKFGTPATGTPYEAVRVSK